MVLGENNIYLDISSPVYVNFKLITNTNDFSICKLDGGWGKILGSVAQTSAAVQFGVNANYTIMARYTPIQAMFLTILAVWLNVVLVGMINYTSNLLLRQGVGIVFSTMIGLSPLLVTRLANYRIGYYLAPPLWMDLSNYKWGGYGFGPTFCYIYAVLFGCIISCTALSYVGIQRKNLNFIEET